MNQEKYEKFKALGQANLAQANATGDIQGRMVHKGYLRAVDEIRQDTLEDEAAAAVQLEIPIADQVDAPKAPKKEEKPKAAPKTDEPKAGKK